MASSAAPRDDTSGTISIDGSERPPVEIGSSSLAELVHELRKTIKRIRAIALLLRYELGEEKLEKMTETLRVTAGHLAGARDADVRLATFEGLRKRHPRALALEGIERFSEQLVREREEARQAMGEQALLDDIERLRRELASFRLPEHEFASLAPGLKRLYGEGRRRYRASRHKPGDIAAAHRWRKRVKGLYYALDSLGGPGTVLRGARRAERLGDLLGEEHDLWLLESYLTQGPPSEGPSSDGSQHLAADPAVRKALLRVASRRRKRLHERAIELGARLYEQRPSDFVKRVEKALS